MSNVRRHMGTFSVFAGKVLVGQSMLEFGDPPMGVAFGKFQPVAAYAEIQRECQINHTNQDHLALSVRTEAGAVVPCAGVSILHSSVESQPVEIEVNVLGIPYPLYGELFPQHVESCERQFPSNRAGA
jgi:hypothetical protein